MKGKIILVVAGHPDDADFGSAATVAKYVSEGATAYYLICTNGARGSRGHKIDSQRLARIRKKEQLAAAKVVGVKETFFLDHADGELEADLHLKEEIVKFIRKLKPDIVFTHDPTWVYDIREGIAFINHNDHRKAGIATIDAVYPLARDLASFPEHIEEGLEPHKVIELYLVSFNNPNFFVDVTNFFNIKSKAVLKHKSQIDDPKQTKDWLKSRLGELGKQAGYKYAEGFIRLVLR
ncbi:MAG: PIG-L family deacetylase [Candidatus Daviesbacteria bacterium]|nr:PIG-L family deacetylase [Candidatus Daviesbacteria bacterium]